MFYKKVKDWKTEDVADWLRHVGLDEYADKFIDNDITGKNLLDLSEDDLKKELGMNSIGHRKDFKKAIDHLRKMYTENYQNLVKAKLVKFYEKNKHRMKKLGGVRDRYGSMKYRSGSYISGEIIDEEGDDDSNVKESPQDYNKNTPPKVDYLNLENASETEHNDTEDKSQMSTPATKVESMGHADASPAQQQVSIFDRQNSGKRDNKEVEKMPSVKKENSKELEPSRHGSTVTNGNGDSEPTNETTSLKKNDSMRSIRASGRETFGENKESKEVIDETNGELRREDSQTKLKKGNSAPGISSNIQRGATLPFLGVEEDSKKKDGIDSKSSSSSSDESGSDSDSEKKNNLHKSVTMPEEEIIPVRFKKQVSKPTERRKKLKRSERT